MDLKAKVWGVLAVAWVAVVALLIFQNNRPSKQLGFRLIPYAEAVDTYATNCNTVTETLIITPDGGQCPLTPLAGRRSITLCSDPRNANFSTPPFIRVRADQTDGGAASMSDSIGMVLASGDCVGYALTAGQPTRCATDQQDAGLLVLECK